MKFEAGEFVEVKLIGFAKVESVGDEDYFLFHSDGKRGGGWKEHDIVGPATEKQFWAEWHKHKRSRT